MIQTSAARLAMTSINVFRSIVFRSDVFRSDVFESMAQSNLPSRIPAMPVAAGYVVMAFVALFANLTVTTQSALAQDQPEVSSGVEIQTFSGLDAATDTVYFNMGDRKIVAADSDWDVAFKGTTIIVSGEAILVDKAFKKVTAAPAEGYKSDKPGNPAIPTGNQEGWFDYDSSSHEITPMPFRTIVIKLARGGFAKMEIVDYYAADDTPRSYTINYALSATEAF